MSICIPHSEFCRREEETHSTAAYRQCVLQESKMKLQLLFSLFLCTSRAAPQDWARSNGQLQQQLPSSPTTSSSLVAHHNNQVQPSQTTTTPQRTSILNRLATFLNRLAARTSQSNGTATNRPSNLGQFGQILKRRNSELEFNTSLRFSRLKDGMAVQGKTREYAWRFLSNPQGRTSELNNRRTK